MGQQTLTILLTALVLGAGVWLGATLFDDTTDPRISEERGRAAERAPPVAEPRLEAGPTVASALRRIEKLEARMASLEEAAAKAKPMLELFESARKDGLLAVDPETGMPSVATETVLVDETDGVRPMADSIGLDAKRTSEFERARARILERAKALEKEHAAVTVDGDTTTIKIEPFGADGEALRREWDDWKRANWGADELQAYEKSGGDNRLFGSRLGQGGRTIEIREAAGSIRVTESSSAADGEGFATEMSGPAMARDLVLQDYLHLLD